MYIFIGPPAIRNFTTTRQVDEGGFLRLRCEALLPELQTMNQTVRFQWAKYGPDIKEILISGNDGRMTTSNDHDPNRSHFYYGTLQIKPVSRLDSGSYTCRISGSFGTSSYSTDTVSVNVKCNVLCDNIAISLC